MAVILPFIVTMLLGRTIDLRNYRISTNVYSDETFTKENKPSLFANYYVADHSESVYRALQIPTDLALYVKANFLSFDEGLSGLDGFIKDTIWEENSVLIPIIITYSTELLTIPKDAEVLENGIKAAQISNSTHYVNGITNGGWSVLVYKFKTDHPLDTKIVKNSIVDTIGEEGIIDDNYVGLWNSVFQKLQSLNLRGPIRYEYNFYSSVSYDVNFTNPSSIKRIIDEFPDHVRKESKDSGGEPIWMHLESLTQIDPSFEKIESYSEFENDIFEVNRMFDDLRETRSLTAEWSSSLREELAPDDEEAIDKLLGDVDDALEVFYDAISKMSLYKKLNKELFMKVSKEYENTLPIPGGTYHLAYRRLKERISTVCQDEFHLQVLGQLRVDSDDVLGPFDDTTEEKCKELCLENSRCRSIEFAKKLSVLNREIGIWQVINNRCKILFRSTSTAPFQPSSEVIGEFYVLDRKCA